MFTYYHKNALLMCLKCFGFSKRKQKKTKSSKIYSSSPALIG